VENIECVGVPDLPALEEMEFLKTLLPCCHLHAVTPKTSELMLGA
jgi:hypothetical protein